MANALNAEVKIFKFMRNMKKRVMVLPKVYVVAS